MDLILDVLEYIAFTIKIVSVLVLLVGLIWYLKDLIKGLRQKRMEGAYLIRDIKNKLGAVVLLGLEILIIADIIETIIDPTFEDVGLLAAIVAIRTVISFFLNKEIESDNEENKVIDEKEAKK